MIKKTYVKPTISRHQKTPEGIPTVIAMLAAGAAVGALSTAVAKAVGIDRMDKNNCLTKIKE